MHITTSLATTSILLSSSLVLAQSLDPLDVRQAASPQAGQRSPFQTRSVRRAAGPSYEDALKRDLLEAGLAQLEARAAFPYALADPEAEADPSLDSVLGDIGKVTGTVGKVAGTATSIGKSLFGGLLGRDAEEEAALMELYARDASLDSVLGDIGKVTDTVGKVAGTATGIGKSVIGSFIKRDAEEKAALMELYARDDIGKVTGTVGKVAETATGIGKSVFGAFLPKLPRRDAEDALFELYARAAAAEAEAEAEAGLGSSLKKGAGKALDFVGEHKDGISSGLDIGQKLMSFAHPPSSKRGLSAREALARFGIGGMCADPQGRGDVACDKLVAREALALAEAEAEAEAMADPEAWLDEYYELDF